MLGNQSVTGLASGRHSTHGASPLVPRLVHRSARLTHSQDSEHCCRYVFKRIILDTWMPPLENRRQLRRSESHSGTQLGWSLRERWEDSKCGRRHRMGIYGKVPGVPGW